MIEYTVQHTAKWQASQNFQGSDSDPACQGDPTICHAIVFPRGWRHIKGTGGNGKHQHACAWNLPRNQIFLGSRAERPTPTGLHHWHAPALSDLARSYREHARAHTLSLSLSGTIQVVFMPGGHRLTAVRSRSNLWTLSCPQPTCKRICCSSSTLRGSSFLPLFISSFCEDIYFHFSSGNKYSFNQVLQDIYEVTVLNKHGTGPLAEVLYS